MARLHQVVRRQGPCYQPRTVTQEEMVIRAMVFILWLVAVRSEAGTWTFRENSLLSSSPDNNDHFEMEQSVEESQRRLPTSDSQLSAQSYSSSGNSTIFRRSVRKVIWVAARQCEELAATDGSLIQRRDAGSLVRILLANLGTELSGEGRKRVASSATKVEGGAAPEHGDGFD
ncbi:hypothetical protein N7456_006900 [Penicillium angulare]|uniref:Uncharacterized protein n=1 Tax=Penicillium angulare TaxID=116970 RepID=A0A9W9FIQ9_9EURO|nr:hypothetical protein N7456_006900 [Penicillium angulare]